MRGSFNPKDAVTGGGFTLEGNFEVIKSVIAVVQLPPNTKTGKQSDPFPALHVEGYKLDENWARSEEPELVHQDFRIGKLEDFRPGSLQNPNDMNEEPEDLGREVGTEGNALFCEQGKQPYKDSAFMMFTDSLLKPGGFKPSEIDKACASVFEGMKLHLKVANMRTYKNADGADVTPTTSVCDQAISVYPYDKPKVGKAVTKPTPAPKAGGGKVVGTIGVTGKTVQAPKGVGGVSAAESTDEPDLMAVALEMITNGQDAISKACPAGTAVKRGTFQMKMNQLLLGQKIDKALHGPIIAMLKDDEKLVELGSMANFEVDTSAGTVTFQE